MMSVNIIDLRGQGAHTGGASVLVDPSGRRYRLLTGMGRIVAAALLVWLCGLVVAGLGLLPAPIVPFASFLGPRSSPPPLDRMPAPRLSSGTHLQPAARASRLVSSTHANDAQGVDKVLVGHRDSSGGHSHGGHRPVSPKPARSGFDGSTKHTFVLTQNMPVRSVAGAPVQSNTGSPGAAPGLTGAKGTGAPRSSGKTEQSGTAGKAGSEPGPSSGTITTQTTMSPSLPGASGSAPGHTESHSREKATPLQKG